MCGRRQHYFSILVKPLLSSICRHPPQSPQRRIRLCAHRVHLYHFPSPIMGCIAYMPAKSNRLIPPATPVLIFNMYSFPPPATEYIACVVAESSRLTPPASAVCVTPSMRALCALLTATRPELQAVSMARQGPWSPNTYEMRPVPHRSFLLGWIRLKLHQVRLSCIISRQKVPMRLSACMSRAKLGQALQKPLVCDMLVLVPPRTR